LSLILRRDNFKEAAQPERKLVITLINCAIIRGGQRRPETIAGQAG
jgi:hypothetical protein